MKIRKRSRALCAVILPLCVLLVMLADWALLQQAKHRALEGDWRETKAWKKAMLSTMKTPDMVFIGSSRTQNHIDTSLLGSLRVSSFNYGIPRTFLADYPSIIKDAAASDAKTLVISFPAGHLFSDPGCPASWRGGDLVFYLKTKPSCLHQPLKRLKEVSNVNSLFVSNEEQVIRRPCSFQRMPGRDPLLDSIHRDYCSRPVKISSFRGGNQRAVVLFSNGDGEIVTIGNHDWKAQRNIRDLSAKSFDASAIRHIQALVALAKSGGTQPVLVVEPDPVNLIVIDEDLYRYFGVPVLYLNSIQFENNEISDELHLSPSGKLRYTYLLHQALQDFAGQSN